MSIAEMEIKKFESGDCNENKVYIKRWKRLSTQ